MLLEDVLDMRSVIESLDDYGKHADGVVIGKLDLHAVVDSIVKKHEPLTIKYLHIKRKGELVQEGDGLRFVSECLLASQEFYRVRDFGFITTRSGLVLFEFTASYHRPERGDMVGFRFTTYNSAGYATFRTL